VSAPYDAGLQIAARKHDLVGIQVYDKYDRELPKAGILQVIDAETNQIVWLDTDSDTTRGAYAQAFDHHQRYCVQSFRKTGAALLHVRTDQDYVKSLQTFFKGR